jgi:DNA repair photolyase
MVAPIIPGINDHEIPTILAAAKAAGAHDARYILLRLPLTVEPVFLEWLKRTQPTKAAKVESLIRQTREGKLYSSDWSQRMQGTGLIAQHIKDVFKLYHQKLAFTDLPPQTTELFKVPLRDSQRMLFD